MNATERAAFKKWSITDGGFDKLSVDDWLAGKLKEGDHLEEMISVAWEAWQAASAERASAEKDAAREPAGYQYAFHGFNGCVFWHQESSPWNGQRPHAWREVFAGPASFIGDAAMNSEPDRE